MLTTFILGYDAIHSLLTISRRIVFGPMLLAKKFLGSDPNFKE